MIPSTSVLQACPKSNKQAVTCFQNKQNPNPNRILLHQRKPHSWSCCYVLCTFQQESGSKKFPHPWSSLLKTSLLIPLLSLVYIFSVKPKNSKSSVEMVRTENLCPLSAPHQQIFFCNCLNWHTRKNPLKALFPPTYIPCLHCVKVLYGFINFIMWCTMCFTNYRISSQHGKVTVCSLKPHQPWVLH